ncbi:T9SS type A sorting domain-containing protein [Labilibacter marinus]|uniref:T9SS type A sorting domain-containing protein n=1 Tax=Labilibacter marinus TaxID=1477105 RepID=UPI0009F93CF2|nr:T9SS type A sorting domain-containing protein [Labilibacter marinus]
MFKKIQVFMLIFLAISGQVLAQTLKEQANEKIALLEALIAEARGKGLDVEREEMGLHTAVLFMRYADWDEANVATNKLHFEAHAKSEFKTNAQQKAEELPDFERQEIINLLKTCIITIRLVIDGEIVRQSAPEIDWKQLVVEDNKITMDGKPVFLADYTWKSNEDELSKYYGATDSEGLRVVYTMDEFGAHETWTYNDWSNKQNEGIGTIWTDQNNVAEWAKTKWPDIQIGGRHYGKFDVDHAGSQKMYALLYENYVPLLAGKPVTKLGYQLWNEPSFFTAADSWNNADGDGVCVSDSTKKHFREWLSKKHQSISDLNQLWGTSFASFDDVKITLPMPNANQGKPIWYDWMTFNNYRITRWFTFMRDEIQKYDPEARVHIKLMPWCFGENAKDHGLDFEALTELSGMSGCDAGMQYLHSWKATPWKSRYSLYWRDAIMTFDFFKSVQPTHLITDTENHFLMNTGFTEQELNQDYVRMAYWLGTMHGLTSASTWVWTRNADGSMKRAPGQSNMTDISHQPQALFNITSTYMDMNAHSEELLKMQELKKPVRVFYSKTSSLNDEVYMDKVFATYESVFFEGVPIGFVTEDIFKKGVDWEFVIINNTEFVTQAELDAIQTYLNNGGTVVLDSKSLKKDEYGRALAALTAGAGTIISANSIEEVQAEAQKLMDSKGLKSDVLVSETNSTGLKACTWKCVKNEKGNHVLSIVNLGNSDAAITIELSGASNGTKCVDLLTGNEVSAKTKLKPFEVYFVEIVDEAPNVDSSIKKLKSVDMGILYPNPTNGDFNIKMNFSTESISMSIYNMNGQQIKTKSYSNVQVISDSIAELPQGNYVVRLVSGSQQQVFKLLKRQ